MAATTTGTSSSPPPQTTNPNNPADSGTVTYYPQSNGKLERWHGSLKQEHWRLQNAESLGDARRVVAEYVDDYNHRRLHSALGYITPADMLNGLADVIFADRDQKLAAARERRRATWRAAREVA